ncbi:hypothetical protein GCM10014713_45240 [Streptomyces purpureus]|uniref:N-acetyltransferase domain-containing protein n=1 Tax=Streptomyces purpureus TaxID=1951 RepID=A0A918H8K6_9ACTN|nr:hypothetical protein GCM10014713_45240 [Streptomyces purpureus]
MASTVSELDQVFHLRRRVFVEEVGYIESGDAEPIQLADEFDSLSTARLIVAYDETEPVATLRLMLPEQGPAARRHDHAMEVHDAWRFEGFDPGDRYAELARMCVLRSHRRQGASLAILALARRESLAAGVTHWVARATMETDHPEDARLIHAIAQARGHCDVPQRAIALDPSPETGVGLRPFYSEAERKAGADSIDGLPYPRALNLFAGLGARYAGPPCFLPSWGTYVLPLVLDMCDLSSAVTELPV